MDELESNTHQLFLEQGNLEEKKAKELAEYLDAKNKEVIMIFFYFYRSSDDSVQSMLDNQQEGQDADLIKEKMAVVHSQV